mmetsp:Transcript_41023/g.80935  ORF Transcript_41023/g.80935 Transcript_41023/m.80935 type:complete len:164 (-) Transcript_41023:682-1173(-)
MPDRAADETKTTDGRETRLLSFFAVFLNALFKPLNRPRRAGRQNRKARVHPFFFSQPPMLLCNESRKKNAQKDKTRKAMQEHVRIHKTHHASKTMSRRWTDNERKMLQTPPLPAPTPRVCSLLELSRSERRGSRRERKRKKRREKKSAIGRRVTDFSRTCKKR